MRRFATAVVVLFAMLVPAAPAQANPADCDPFNDNAWFCVYYNSLATGELQRFGIVARNTCYDARAVLGGSYLSYTNETYYRWFMFNTLTCGGSHWEVPPFSTGVNPGGPHVAIMRTSLRS